MKGEDQHQAVCVGMFALAWRMHNADRAGHRNVHACAICVIFFCDQKKRVVGIALHYAVGLTE